MQSSNSISVEMTSKDFYQQEARNLLLQEKVQVLEMGSQKDKNEFFSIEVSDWIKVIKTSKDIPLKAMLSDCLERIRNYLLLKLEKNCDPYLAGSILRAILINRQGAVVDFFASAISLWLITGIDQRIKSNILYLYKLNNSKLFSNNVDKILEWLKNNNNDDKNESKFFKKLAYLSRFPNEELRNGLAIAVFERDGENKVPNNINKLLKFKNIRLNFKEDIICRYLQQRETKQITDIFPALKCTDGDYQNNIKIFCQAILTSSEKIEVLQQKLSQFFFLSHKIEAFKRAMFDFTDKIVYPRNEIFKIERDKFFSKPIPVSVIKETNKQQKRPHQRINMRVISRKKVKWDNLEVVGEKAHYSEAIAPTMAQNSDNERSDDCFLSLSDSFDEAPLERTPEFSLQEPPELVSEILADEEFPATLLPESEVSSEFGEFLTLADFSAEVETKEASIYTNSFVMWAEKSDDQDAENLSKEFSFTPV